MEDNQMTLNATDFENQVVNLVKAAMSGDEEANDVIVQIIEAAKKGDEQALKVVALIKQLTQSNSDQAEEGAEENTEVMKCGGKVRAKMKAKKSAEKKEEGGEIPEEKCGGTAKKMRKVACKAKKCEEGDKLTDTQKFLLGAKCGAKMKKPKKCESGDHIEELEDYLAVKCGGKMKKTKKHEEGGLISLDFSQIDFAKCGKKLKKKEDGGEIAEEKCGGKAKKVKKGEVGVRLPEGAHGQIRSKSISAVFAKGGNTCPCALKRIGGKIVTVDTCTGLPIHKNGGNVNYLLTGGTSTYRVGPNGNLESATPDSPIKKNKFFQYLSEIGPMLRGARLNSPAVMDVEETVKTDPERAKVDAANYAAAEAISVPGALAPTSIYGSGSIGPRLLKSISGFASTELPLIVGAGAPIMMSAYDYPEFMSLYNHYALPFKYKNNHASKLLVTPKTSTPTVVSEQPVSTIVK